MASVDTNVLVRWLVDDEPAQSLRAKQLFESARTARTTVFVPCTVMLELEWVLRSRYGFDKPTILRTFVALLETKELEIQMEPALEHALHAYRGGNADFADCFHAGLVIQAARIPLLTFDARAAKIPEVKLLDA